MYDYIRIMYELCKNYIRIMYELIMHECHIVLLGSRCLITKLGRNQSSGETGPGKSWPTWKILSGEIFYLLCWILGTLGAAVARWKSNGEKIKCPVGQFLATWVCPQGWIQSNKSMGCPVVWHSWYGVRLQNGRSQVRIPPGCKVLSLYIHCSFVVKM
jgi:hypothetical protein